MEALLAVLAGAVAIEFTADLAARSDILSNPNPSAGLFLGLPVFGVGIPKGALISSLNPLTISLAATANAIGAHLSSGFAATGRRVQFPKDGPLPKLVVRALDEDLEYQGSQQLQTIKAEAWIASEAGEDPTVVPETALNNFLDALQSALAPDDLQSGINTLGGLVAWCRMSGKVEKDTGDIGPLAIAVADIEIFVP